MPRQRAMLAPPAMTPALPRYAAMTVCPIALAVGCRKCPVFAVCPLTTVLGDQVKDAPAGKPAEKSAGKAKAKRK